MSEPAANACTDWEFCMLAEVLPWLCRSNLSCPVKHCSKWNGVLFSLVARHTYIPYRTPGSYGGQMSENNWNHSSRGCHERNGLLLPHRKCVGGPLIFYIPHVVMSPPGPFGHPPLHTCSWMHIFISSPPPYQPFKVSSFHSPASLIRCRLSPSWASTWRKIQTEEFTESSISCRESCVVAPRLLTLPQSIIIHILNNNCQYTGLLTCCTCCLWANSFH